MIKTYVPDHFMLDICRLPKIYYSYQWKENSDLNAGGSPIPSGWNQMDSPSYNPAHNKSLSKVTTSTRFHMVSKQQEHKP